MLIIVACLVASNVPVNIWLQSYLVAVTWQNLKPWRLSLQIKIYYRQNRRKWYKWPEKIWYIMNAFEMFLDPVDLT